MVIDEAQPTHPAKANHNEVRVEKATQSTAGKAGTNTKATHNGGVDGTKPQISISQAGVYSPVEARPNEKADKAKATNPLAKQFPTDTNVAMERRTAAKHNKHEQTITFPHAGVVSPLEGEKVDVDAGVVKVTDSQEGAQQDDNMVTFPKAGVSVPLEPKQRRQLSM